jgi:hypothetical protein
MRLYERQQLAFSRVTVSCCGMTTDAKDRSAGSFNSCTAESGIQQPEWL